jgi:hypothetical protein
MAIAASLTSSGERISKANKRGAPRGIISLQGGGFIQESLGAIIPLQTLE